MKGGHLNSIIDLLDLEDPDVFVSDVKIDGQTKIVTLETHPAQHFCPQCGFRMHSRGIKQRKINHPVLQDSYRLQLLLKQRRWRCTNPECLYEMNENFRFVNKYRRNTNATDLLIVEAFRDLNITAAAVARKFNLSDTQVLDVFDRYVKLDRLPLTDAISVDEVHVDMDRNCKYALIIQDFYTGEPIDMLRSRRSEITEPYFASIPKEERLKVKYLISDMYNQYLQYVGRYFPNAVPVVDSFHVIQWLIRQLENFIRELVRRFKERDRIRQAQLSIDLHREVKLPVSDEVYLLQNYRWILLKNQKSITYYQNPVFDHHFRYYMNTYDYERKFFEINPHLQEMRDFKEMYIHFNERYAGDPEGASRQLDWLIAFYLNCGNGIFSEFARLLQKYHDPIINSFVMVSRIGPGGLYDARLSNGPIESINRKVKDLKRMGRGFRNFEHMRNRFLFSTRNNPVINGSSDASPIQYFDNND